MRILTLCPLCQTISGTNLFVCNLGPTGGAKGYEAITGNPPDDMSVVWWINNLLLPEIYVERGKTYWFRVQVNYATIADGSSHDEHVAGAFSNTP